MIIIANKYGQLGNRLFYLRAFLSVAMETGRELLILSFDEYAHYFVGSSKATLCRYPVRERGGSFQRWLSTLCYRFFSVAPWLSRTTLAEPDADERIVFNKDRLEWFRQRKRVLVQSGWPCVAEDVLARHAGAVRDYFRLTTTHQQTVDQFMATARTMGDLLVGIHIRQGDYREWNGGRHYFETPVYLRLMKELKTKYPGRKIVFVVCASDEQDWAQYDDLTYLKGPGDAVLDMYCLAECDVIYGPQSSFSAWASFYGERPLVKIENEDVVSLVREQNIADDERGV